ncbi:nogalamycin resistance protein SnorO [Streptomyces sp. SPB074]|nr:nogalamycin resistance protein SnorO [Streptomyces sp. SPB074]
MTQSRPSAPQVPADSHALIRVVGARENNLKDVSVELPKRRLTVFTGVSGSGKSSLVFHTVAAESQRLINETYSAFVQGFMPNRARPDVDVLDGLTTAIVVDQQRLGGDPRSTVGTATDAYAMLRVLYSRLGTPHLGGPGAFSFNTATVEASGALTVGKEHARAEKVSFHRTGGGCAHAARGAARSRTWTSRGSTTPRSPSPTAPSWPPATRRAAGTRGCTRSRGCKTRASRSGSSPSASCTTSCTASRSV